MHNNTNFSPYISPFQPTTSDLYPAEPIYTELARSFSNIVGVTPLTEMFPVEEIPQRIVIMDISFENIPTIMPLVDWAKPDVITGYNAGRSERRVITPLAIRESKFISYGQLNTRIRPGTLSEFADPDQIIEQTIRDLVTSHNLTWDVYRGMMLMGGISYTDPRTGASIDVTSGIPIHNQWSYDTTEGYRGRNESSLFLRMDDANSLNSLTQGTPWTDPNADIIGTMMKISSWFRTTNKSRVTRIAMSSSLAHILMFNNQVKHFMGMPVFNLFPNQVVDGAPQNINNTMMNFTVGSEGLQSIAGIPITTIETIYKDPVTNTARSVFPKNRIVLLSEVDALNNREAPGRTQYCISENEDSSPGMWTRTVDHTLPPQAPGLYIQLGNAGMPYLKFPFRVAHMVVGSPNDINKRLGVVGDYQFGMP